MKLLISMGLSMFVCAVILVLASELSLFITSDQAQEAARILITQ